MKENPSLPYLSQEDRLKIYNLIIGGCSHLWSKNKLQEEKVVSILQDLLRLSQDDPYFLAHFTAWAAKRDSKDLRVTTTYVNALSSADGMPFSAKSKYKKPNLRYVSSALLQELDPKLALRIRQLAMLKWTSGDLKLATHLPTALATAFKKYILFREKNLFVLKGISKSGLSKTMKNLYRLSHLNPSDEAAAILRWKQKDREIKFIEPLVDFKGLKDIEIAEKIRKEKIPYFGVMEGLSKSKKKMSPVITVAILEQVTGNQAVILRSMFEEQGVLKDKEVLELYEKKIREAKTALDRAETVSKGASEEVARVLKKARSETRKQALRGLGKVYLHLDASGSMGSNFEHATRLASILAECVDDPTENFRWGIFGDRGKELPLPEEFIQDAFKAILFGMRADAGATDVFALYPKARTFGAEIDVIITDQGHNVGVLADKIERFHHLNPTVPKPRACMIVDVASYADDEVQKAYEANQIPVAVVKPDVLTESALVVQTIEAAIRGPMAIIDAIMETELPDYPKWWTMI